MIKPKHLEKIYHPTDEEGYEGRIICQCGCKAFKIRCFGEFYGRYKMSVREYENKYAQAVRAVCGDCGTDYLLYDFALHGYDGLICGEGIAVPDEILDDFITETDSLFEVEMFLEYDGEEDFLEDVVNDTWLQKDFHFTVADRVNVWCSVAIELKGVQSGTDYKDFLIEELA